MCARPGRSLPKDVFDVWIKPTQLVMIDDLGAAVATPNLIVRPQVEQQYSDCLEECLRCACGKHLVLKAVIG